MTRYLFVPAVKTGSHIRLALMGPPGSGKTWTALTLAKALGDNPGVIDTERQRARKYSDVFAFHHLPVENNFDPAELTRMTIDAAEQGINPLIVDTWTPFWSGHNGMLDQVGRAVRDFEGWRQMRPIERQMVDALCGFPGHVIVNLRVKTEWVVERNSDGKMEPRRVGLKPEQRDGLEYEFDIVGDMDDATLRVSKSMCRELPAGTTIVKPTEDVGEVIVRWLERDAVGQPHNPLTVREWALDPARTVDELGVKYRELDAVGQTTAVVYAAHEGGSEFVAIGDLLKDRARALKKDAERAAATAHRAPVGAAA